MNTENFGRLEELFHEALLFEAGPVRDLFLDNACQGSAILRERVERLLQADEEQMAGPAEPSPPELPQFGIFQADRIIGRGGTGTVYLAHRTDGQFDQVVAIKLLAWELSDPRIRDAFLNERQILASLAHPGIAAIIDGGTTESGTPYLVMEYIDGKPLDTYCREGRMGLRERLNLLEGICDAVSFAHRNLIIHLDLKPSNVLVTETQHVKVLDFGTAKILTHPEAAVTQRIATPRYASPEQLRGERAGIASDVFSIGVIAAELLTGAWPFGDPQSGMDRMRRAVEEVNAPALADLASEGHAQACGMEFSQLRRALRGDLDAIVQKAIRREPSARYASVDQLAADIRAYSAGLPVQARQLGQWYVARKFMRRHRAALAFSAAAVIGLAATTAVALHERHVAYENYAGMRDLTTSMLFELKNAISDVPGATDAQRILVSRVLKNLDHMKAFSSDPTLRFDVAECYRQLGELQGSPYVPNLGDWKRALESLGHADLIAQAQLQRNGTDPSWLWLAGFIQQNIGEVYFGQNNASAAAEHLRRATGYFDRMVPRQTDRSRYMDASSAHGVLGDVVGSPNLASLYDRAGAEAEYTRSIELDEAAVREWPDYARARRGLALVRAKRSDLLRDTDPGRALTDVELSLRDIDSLDRTERERPGTQRTRVMIQIKRGEILAILKNWQMARAAMEEALAFYRERSAADPHDDRAMVDLASTEGKLLEIAFHEPGANDALVISGQVIAAYQNLLKKDPGVLIYRTELAVAEAHRAVLLMRSGRSAEASFQASQARKELESVLHDPKAGGFQVDRCKTALAEIRDLVNLR